MQAKQEAAEPCFKSGAWALVGRECLILVLIERMSSAISGRMHTKQNFENPWHMRDARGWVAWQQCCVGGS